MKVAKNSERVNKIQIHDEKLNKDMSGFQNKERGRCRMDETLRTEKEHRADGTLDKIKYYRQDGTLEAEEEYTSKGKTLQQEKYYRPDGSLRYYNFFTGEDGEILAERCTYSLDGHTIVILEQFNMENGNLDLRMTYNSTDKFGRLETTEAYHEDGKTLGQRNYYHHDNGILARTEVYRKSDGTLEKKHIYDHRSRKLQYVERYKPDGTCRRRDVRHKNIGDWWDRMASKSKVNKKEATL